MSEFFSVNCKDGFSLNLSKMLTIWIYDLTVSLWCVFFFFFKNTSSIYSDFKIWVQFLLLKSK